jgi:chemotaxis protein MotA
MNYIIGLFIATFALFAAMNHLNQGPEQYWDLVAFSIVLGGTLAVAAMTLPWIKYREIFQALGKLLFHVPFKKKDFAKLCLDLVSKKADIKNLKNSKKFHEQILAEGVELIHLGLSPEKIQKILLERIHYKRVSNEEIANSIRSLAKYPPAFGLTGTVFGLVELMKGVSQGMPAKETGIKMAIALVATLYGLLVANLLINPAGEHIRKLSKEEEELAEISLQTVLLVAHSVNLLESQELINSMLPVHDRVDLISSSNDMGAVA